MLKLRKTEQKREIQTPRKGEKEYPGNISIKVGNIVGRIKARAARRMSAVMTESRGSSWSLPGHLLSVLCRHYFRTIHCLGHEQRVASSTYCHAQNRPKPRVGSSAVYPSCSRASGAGQGRDRAGGSQHHTNGARVIVGHEEFGAVIGDLNRA
jgi:hypothetical protein